MSAGVLRFSHGRGAGAVHIDPDREARKVSLRHTLREASAGNFSDSHAILDPNEARVVAAYLRAAADEVDDSEPQARIFELRRDDNDRAYFAPVGSVPGMVRAPAALTIWFEENTDALGGTYYCEDAQGGYLTIQHVSARAA